MNNKYLFLIVLEVESPRVPLWPGESLLLGCRLPIVSLHGGRSKGALLVVFYKSIKPTPGLKPCHLPKVPPPKGLTS